MAEARREEDQGELRDIRDIVLRNQNTAADRSERTKPDHIHTSQGPLSSIRAAIKRTRNNSQVDHSRDRRRPEITILSAEPLANSWFSGGPGVFPQPPPSLQSWPGSGQAASPPPPSYDQVIKEKTQWDHVAKPTAAPRRSACTSSSGTQTDPVREDTATPALQHGAEPAVKHPQKPPRPSLSKVPKREPTTGTRAPPTDSEKSPVGGNVSPVSTKPRTRSVAVHWDAPADPGEPLSTSTQSSSLPEASSPSPDAIPSKHPTPLPRLKFRPPGEVKVQTLVRLSGDGGACVQVTPTADPVSHNKYLDELLEVFGAEYQGDQDSDTSNESETSEQSDDNSGEMSALHSARNIQARIKAFESQANVDDGSTVEAVKPPDPRPRNSQNKPPVAAKPSLAPKPSFKRSVESDTIPSSGVHYSFPAVAPRPQSVKKPVGLPPKPEPVALPADVALTPPSRSSIMAKAKLLELQMENNSLGSFPVNSPKQPLRPNLNLNNHNSTSMERENEYVDSPTIKPQSSVDGALFSLTRRPTTIRVPNKAEWSESPPPLPIQKAVGSLSSPASQKPNMLPESFSVAPTLSLPPRPVGGKVLRPRPPSTKAGPGRPPPPRFNDASRSVPVQVSPWEPSPRAQPLSQKSKRRGPAFPSRPSPGHRLYNKYILELPHGISVCDYNGNSAAGEVSFQKNEVLLLLEEVDHRTCVCQVADKTGRVQRSHMKVITPLSSVPSTSLPQVYSPAGSRRDSCGLQVEATHDFNPEGQGELCLRAGDVVSVLEQVDNDWYRGTCRGSTGLFPVNYVQVLSNSPPPSNEKKVKTQSTAVSGPRCVARFDFDGEHSDELSFSEGDVIRLKDYVGQEWARGEIGALSGIFPLNFVEIIEDLPPPQIQEKTQPTRKALPAKTQPETAKSSQGENSGVEWVVALYDFAGETEDDLAFQQGDRILVTKYIDAEWCTGKLHGREGIFPKAFVEASTARQLSLDIQQMGEELGGRAKALFDFTSNCEEELSLRVGDVITNVESIDDEWFLGDLRGKRALVPKNYVQILK